MATKTIGNCSLMVDQMSGDMFTCILSSESVDRDGEVLLMGGCDVSHYQNQVFFDHDPTKLIGVCQDIQPLNTSPEKLQATVRVLPEAVCNSEVKAARNILRYAIPLGLKPGISMGFIRLETRAANQRDRQVYGPACKRVTSKWELIEISIALLQCNRDAFITGVSKGYFSADGLKRLGFRLDGTQARKKIVVYAYSPPNTAETIRALKSWGRVFKHNPAAKPVVERMMPRKGTLYETKFARIVREELGKLMSEQGMNQQPR